MTEHTYTESFKVAGSQLVEAVRKLVREGNVRRVSIKQDKHTIVEFPLTVGVIGAVLAPLVAALGAIAAVLAECTVEVERVAPADSEAPQQPPA